MSIVAPVIASGSFLQWVGMKQAALYEAILRIIGTTGTILPIGDHRHGQPNATTFTTVGDQQVVFTWSEAPNAFDTKLDLTDPASFQGIVPIVAFNGTDERASTPDAAYWSRGNGTSDSPFSLGLWVNVTDTAANRIMMTKRTTSNLEWEFYVDNNEKLYCGLWDNSVSVTAKQVSNAAISQGTWQFFVATYSGVGGASAHGGIVLYANGASIASTGSTGGGYTAMEDKAGKPTIGNTEDGTAWFLGSMAGGPLGPFFVQAELTADQIARLYQVGRRALGL